MSQDVDPRVQIPVPVDIRNWADSPAKAPVIKKTTLRTYILDPANVNTADRVISICNYEPKRTRLVIDVIDAQIGITTESVVTSPGVSVAAGPAPQGRVLPTSGAFEGYNFYGPDAFWIYPLGAVTRVTVTSEFLE